MFKNWSWGIFDLSKSEFNITYKFRFIFDFLYISCRFLFLHSSLHTPYIKAGELFMINRIRVFYSPGRTLDGKIRRYAFNRKYINPALKRNIKIKTKRSRLILTRTFHEPLVFKALLIYIYIFYISNTFHQ